MTIPQDKNESKLFFSYFYWSINLGALVSYTLVAYICQYGISFLGGEDWGFFIGYLIPTMMLAVGLMIFYSGSKRYKKNSPEGSIINQVVGVFYEACILRRHIKIDNHDTMTEKIINEETTHSEHVKKTDIEREINESNVWLDRASSRFGGSYDKTLIQSIKYIVRLSPYLLVMIPYWGIYGQTKTAFQIQGCQMNVSLGSLDLPVSAMNIFNNVSILILVPLFERYLYPFLKAKGYELSMLQKIGIGFIFAILAMLAAAIIEYFRQEYVHTSGNYYDEKAKDNISPCRLIFSTFICFVLFCFVFHNQLIN
jgi:peptide/histidine transporter 3/4